MNKNTIVILITVLALIVGFFIGRFTSNRYYFMKEFGSGALVVIRCDQMNGGIDLFLTTEGETKSLKVN